MAARGAPLYTLHAETTLPFDSTEKDQQDRLAPHYLQFTRAYRLGRLWLQLLGTLPKLQFFLSQPPDWLIAADVDARINTLVSMQYLYLPLAHKRVI